MNEGVVLFLIYAGLIACLMFAEHLTARRSKRAQQEADKAREKLEQIRREMRAILEEIKTEQERRINAMVARTIADGRADHTIPDDGSGSTDSKVVNFPKKREP